MSSSPPVQRAGWLRRYRLLVAVGVALLLVAGLWAVRLVDEWAGVGRARTYWASPHGEAGGLLYVALGDSAAQGVGASRPDRGYVGLLAVRLRDRCGCPVQVVNLSVSGARIQDVLDRQVPQLARLHPDVVTVDAGGNDVAGGLSNRDLAVFAARVDRLTALLPAGAYVADVPYFMHGGREGQAGRAAAVLARSARARGLPVVALHAAQRARGWSAMLTDFAPDFFHPNDRGYQVWAKAFWSAMQSRPVGCGPRAPGRMGCAGQGPVTLTGDRAIRPWRRTGAAAS